MQTKTCLLLCVLFIVACKSSETREKDELKIFLTEWSSALQKDDKSVLRFYDPQFQFPGVIFDAPDGLTFRFDLEDLGILKREGDDNLYVRVSFEITPPNESEPERGSVELTIVKTEKGYIIKNMTREFAIVIKEHTVKLAEVNSPTEITLHYDSIINNIQSLVKQLRAQYDSVVFLTEVDELTLFYVVNGRWENPYSYEKGKQRNAGDYKIGVVTAENKVIVPVEYSKIYNPNGSFKGMIEVENNGLRGLFHITGGVFLPAEFDGLYPTRVSGAIAQVKKGNDYGWVDNNGRVSFDPASHIETKIFQSPVESKAILEWEFKFPGQINLLLSPYDHPADANGIIVYPSFVNDFGIAKIAHSWVAMENGYGMGMTDTSIKFEKVETLSEKFFGLIAFFMEAGADARDYHSIQNDLLVVDRSLKTVDHVPSITDDSQYQDPCGEAMSTCRYVAPGLFESENGHGIYRYFEVAEDGTVHELKTNRQYNFTKFVELDQRYFTRCTYESLPYDYESKNGNLVLTEGVDLDIMRNEIFAEYGFKFKSPKWKAYFEAKPWYKPQYDNVDHLLTEKDKANIKFILDYQSVRKDVKLNRDTIFFGWAG